MSSLHSVCFLKAIWNVQIIFDELASSVIFIRVCVLQSWTFRMFSVCPFGTRRNGNARSAHVPRLLMRVHGGAPKLIPDRYERSGHFKITIISSGDKLIFLQICHDVLRIHISLYRSTLGYGIKFLNLFIGYFSHCL